MRRWFDDSCNSLAPHAPSRVCLDKSVNKHGSYIRHPLFRLSLGTEWLAVTELHGAACTTNAIVERAKACPRESQRGWKRYEVWQEEECSGERYVE